MNFTEKQEELLNKINSLIELIDDLKMKKEERTSLFTDEFSQRYQTHLTNTISIVEKQINEYKKQLIELEKKQRVIEIREENRKNGIDERERIKNAIAAQQDYSSKSDEELRHDYSYIRAQIKRIAKKIWDLCERKEIPTYYHYNDSLEIELKKSEGVPVSEMIFEMNEIISNLEANLSAIEECYRGMDLKTIPVIEIPEEEFEEYQEESREIENMLRDNQEDLTTDNYSYRMRN